MKTASLIATTIRTVRQLDELLVEGRDAPERSKRSWNASNQAAAISTRVGRELPDPVPVDRAPHRTASQR